MSNTAWGILSLIGLILNLTALPIEIIERKHISAAIRVIFSVLSAMAMVYFFICKAGCHRFHQWSQPL